MTVGLNHTIVVCSDQERSAKFLSEILGRAAPTRFGPFTVVTLDNGVSMDFHSTDRTFGKQHYAFLTSEPEFDTIFSRIRDRGLTYWADPGKHRAGEINHHDGGRGVYFEDPDGHFLEIITRPYGTEQRG